MRRQVIIVLVALAAAFGAVSVGVWNFVDTDEPVSPVRLTP